MSTIWVRSHRDLMGSEKKVEKILVIGGAGHIGLALVPQLLSLGYRVRVLDRHLIGKDGFGKSVSNRNLEVVCGDFSDLNTVVAAMSGMDTVVHLGDVLSDPGYDGNDELLLETNRIATRLVGSCAKAVHIRRFIFASSQSVYGCSASSVDEASALHPTCLHGRAKAESESELTKMSGKRFQPTVLRFGTVHGAGARSRFNDIVSYFARHGQGSSGIALEASDHLHSFIHLHDVVQAIVLCLRAPEKDICGEVFNVGSEREARNMVDVAELIRTETQHAGLRISASSHAGVGRRICFNKIRMRTGFEPKASLEVGVKEVVKASRAGDVSSTLNLGAGHVPFEDLGLVVREVSDPSHVQSSNPILR